jgi:hypothetical protein
MKKAVFWDVAPCRSGVNRRFGGTYRLHLQGRRENIRKSARETFVSDVTRIALPFFFFFFFFTFYNDNANEIRFSPVTYGVHMKGV